MSNVKIKDYEKPQHLVLVALRLVGLNLNYETADLIHTTLEKVNDLGEKFSIKDASNIQVKHEEKWDRYYQKLNSDNLI